MEYNLSLQNLRYRHKQYIKLPKYKLAYMNFIMGYFFSVVSQKLHSTKMFYCQNSDIREASIALV